MKSIINKNRFYLECSCESPDHLFIFDYDEELNMITVSFQYNNYLSFFKRFKCAWSYLFKKRDLYCHDIIIQDKHVKQVQDMVNYLKEKTNE